MEIVVCEIFLDDIAHIPAADDKIVDAVVGVILHDMPQNGLFADFKHRLRGKVAFFAYPGAVAARENDCFHVRFNET